MKKFLMAVSALSMVAAPMIATPAMAAPARHDNGRHDNGRHDNGRQTTVYKQTNKRVTVNRYNQRQPYAQQRRWARGQRFDRRYAQNYRVVDYRGYRTRGVYAPPRGYQWVRSGDDAVLVGITSGLIAAVIANAIH